MESTTDTLRKIIRTDSAIIDGLMETIERIEAENLTLRARIRELETQLENQNQK